MGRKKPRGPLPDDNGRPPTDLGWGLRRHTMWVDGPVVPGLASRERDPSLN